MAATISTIQASRTFNMLKPFPQGRDEDRNIISNEPTEVRLYEHDTGLIPSKRFEELIRLMTKDPHQALLIYHQLIQGKL